MEKLSQSYNCMRSHKERPQSRAYLPESIEDASAFAWEIEGVRHGLSEHRKHIEQGQGEGLIAQLSRNIHRLEKGLIMRPQREVFALDYLENTLLLYQRCLDQYRVEPCNTYINKLSWATAVLDRYFERPNVPSAEETSACYEAYQQLRSECCTSIGRDEYFMKFAPYAYALLANGCNYDQFYRLAESRKSVRWYKQVQVDREKIDRAIEVALMSPSACNRQPFRFLVYDDAEMIHRVGSIPMGTKGFYDNFPGLIIVVGDLSAFEHPRDRHLIYIDGSLAAMSLVYGLQSQGIASCCINWPEVGTLEQEMAELLELEPHERPVMLISYGYPDTKGLVPYSMKKSLEDAREFNYMPQRND